MNVSYSLAAGATYIQWTSNPVAHTVSVSDLVMVDLDADGQPVGVDFAVSPQKITDRMLTRVAERFPSLKGLLDRQTWMYASV